MVGLGSNRNESKAMKRILYWSFKISLFNLFISLVQFQRVHGPRPWLWCCFDYFHYDFGWLERTRGLLDLLFQCVPKNNLRIVQQHVLKHTRCSAQKSAIGWVCKSAHRGLLFWSFPSPLASFLSTTAFPTTSLLTRTWSLQPRWTRWRCNNFTFQVLFMLFLPTSMSMALSSFHNFLEFGLPNRSPAKLSFDQTCCFNYGGFQACYWTTWCKNGEPGEFEILPRLFPLPCIFDPWQDRTWTIRNLQLSNRRISVERFITNIVWEHPSGHNWMRSYFLWYKTKQNEN